eukprot:844824-Amphidinium_carterae.1
MYRTNFCADCKTEPAQKLLAAGSGLLLSDLQLLSRCVPAVSVNALDSPAEGAGACRSRGSYRWKVTSRRS